MCRFYPRKVAAMTAKAKQCDECIFWRYWLVADDRDRCVKQHKPRFYQQQVGYSPSWGWKRRCDDFKPREQK